MVFKKDFFDQTFHWVNKNNVFKGMKPILCIKYCLLLGNNMMHLINNYTLTHLFPPHLAIVLQLNQIGSRRKKLDLPFLDHSNSRMKSETDKKLLEIMSGNGILKIAGKQYNTDLKDLIDLGELGNGTSGHVVKMRHQTTGTIIAVKVSVK